jgi:prolyl-tRNA synthetase
MAHSDDNGLIIPPKLAPIQVVIVPIFKTQEQYNAISEKVKSLKTQLEHLGISVKFDDRDTHKPGWKFAEYELKGVPVRLAMGPRDLENSTVEVARRDTLEKQSMELDDTFPQKIAALLDQMQTDIYHKALKFQQDNTHTVDDYEEFKRVLDEEGGFVYAHWDGTDETEAKIKEETKATIRCIPLNAKAEEGKCIYSGKPSQRRVLFAKAY